MKRINPISNQIIALTQSPSFKKGSPKIFNQYCQVLFRKYLYIENNIDELSLNFCSTTSKNQVKIETLFTKGLFEKYYDFRTKLNKLHIPTLVIHGDVDPIPLWTAQQIADSIPNSDLIVIKQSGHFSYMEQKMEVYKVINHFIDSNKY